MLAEAIDRFVRKRRLEDWTLLGHSFGGFVAMQYLVDFPGSAAADRLVHRRDEEPAPGGRDRSRGCPRTSPPRPRRVRPRGSRSRRVDDCRRVWLEQMPFFVGALERVETLRAAFTDVAYRVEVDARGRARLGRAARARPRCAQRHPGAGDRGRGAIARSRPPTRARIAEAAPRGELLVIEGAGHFPFAEDPAAYWGGVREWLAR